eukprot:3781038-Alexandrium_andersonii.AAC.1
MFLSAPKEFNALRKFKVANVLFHISMYFNTIAVSQERDLDCFEMFSGAATIAGDAREQGPRFRK